MRTGEFGATQWVERLARALTELAETQKPYRAEIHQQRQRRSSQRDPYWLGAFDHPSHDLQSFYWHACSKGRYYAEHYGPLRAALDEVQGILAMHPALAVVLDSANDRDEIWIRAVDHGGLGTLSSMIGGLVARGMEVPEDGFRVAAAELHRLLGGPGGDGGQISVPSDLSVGYHVVLFHGLRVSEKIPLADDTALLPFKQLDAFVNEDVLRDVAPTLLRYNDQKSVGALVKPFRWKPEVRKQGDNPVPDLDWGGSFFEDAEAFIELLALCHTAPVICLVTIPYCIHRTASYLLGQLHYHSGYTWGRSVGSFDRFAKSTDLSVDALDEARTAFGYRQSANYQYCAPIIARLAEGLARSGRFQIDDKILDVAIALEQMYELEGGEISFKLKARAACFLETSTESRVRVFQDVEQLYNARSAIVHKRKSKKRSAADAKHEAFTRGFAVARRSVVKLLREGPPSDWNTLVLAGTEPSAPKPGGEDETA